MKGVFKWAGTLLGVPVLIILAARIVVMFLVDKEMIAGRMESALNRDVTIDGIDIGLFSVVSGVEVAGVKISNHKTLEQMEALKGKAVAESDLFAGLKRLTNQDGKCISSTRWQAQQPPRGRRWSSRPSPLCKRS